MIEDNATHLIRCKEAADSIAKAFAMRPSYW